MINYIWLFFVVSSVVFAFSTGKMQDVSDSVFSSAQSAVEISIGLIGIMSLWLGIVEIAKRAKLLEAFSKLISPVLRLIFPSIPKNDEVQSDIAMNVASNALGLGNAATPFGIKAMEGLQRLNKNEKDTASDDMCTFLTINTAGVQLIPITVISILVSLGGTNPTDIILPTLISTFGALVIGLAFVKFLIKISPEPSKKGETKCKR